ncbi:MAG TPA: aldolase catalytic domain-containing protein [Verrucomicrobiae bacterium]|nr:aldolase catalytic domain-containing protein [Verrucomicrobiae bacterium]
METGDNLADSGWVGYRPQIKVVDCTIRDGGLMNNSRFEDGVVGAVYRACVQGGIDYMEIGYRNSRKIFSPDQYGAWRYSHEDDIRRIVGENPTNLKLAVMADAEKSDYRNEIPKKSESVVDLVRVACYIHQIPLALDMVKDAHDKGYETTVNLMAASVIQEREMDEALALIANSEARGVYLVDSFGHFYSEQVRCLITKYMLFMRPAGKAVGIHAHNNLQLAFANTIEAIVLGANMADATMAGLGRGAGNCPMELLIGFLHNPKYNLRPVLDCAENRIEPMRKSLKWGFDLPYLISGLLNRHPRLAIKFNEAPERGDVLDFYDRALAGE